MKYTITITREGWKEAISGGSWEVLEEIDGKKNYGYTPQVKQTKRIKEDVLVQVVDELDLNKVIKAINNIE